MSFELAELALMGLIIGFGAFVQAGLGFGLGIVAAPFLVLIEPELVPGIVLFMVLLVGGLTVTKDYGSLVFRELSWIWIGRLPGTALGAAFLVVSSAAVLSIILGVSVLLAVALSLRSPRVARTRGHLTAAGAASGFMAATTSMGGPPVALIYQDAADGYGRTNLAADMFVGTIVALAALIVVGRFTTAHLMVSAMMLVPAWLGFIIARLLLPKLNAKSLRAALLVLCAVAGVTVILGGLFRF